MFDTLDDPNIAHCEGPGCTRTMVFPAENDRRQAERDLAANGWYWEVDYDIVHTLCPEHRSR